MKKKPMGINILSILALINGIPIVIMTRDSMYTSDYRKLIAISFLFIGILAVSSGIGMLLGKKWGWWLGSFYYAYAISRYFNTIITVGVMVVRSQLLISDATTYIIKYGIRIVIHCFILLYFFNNDVKEYFNVVHCSKLKTILILFGICIAIFGISTLTMYIISNRGNIAIS